ncbi:MAG: hypothetical protein WDA60_05890 [Acidimicrobiia bacterium]
MIVRPLALSAFTLVLVLGSAPPAPAAGPKPATSACKVLTAGEIASVFTGAPLDPGPKRVTVPNADKRFTRCEWDDHENETTPQVAAYTGLARKVKATQLAGLGVADPGTAARDLTKDELVGLGDRGVVELVQGNRYGNIAVVKGKDAMFVSVTYQGPGALPQVTEADMLAIARLAAARL